MDTSILLTIKKSLGVDVTYEGFDSNLIMFINTAIMALNQIGVGVDGFVISSADDLWSDLFGEQPILEAAKSYILLSVRLAFDPPTSSFLLEAIGNQISELTWRLEYQIQSETP